MQMMSRPPTGPLQTELLADCAAAREACCSASDCDWEGVAASDTPDLPVLLQECAALLELTEASLQRGSPLLPVLTHAAAEACEQVAIQCAQWEQDPRLGECATRCRASAMASRHAAQALSAVYPQWSRRLV